MSVHTRQLADASTTNLPPIGATSNRTCFEVTCPRLDSAGGRVICSRQSRKVIGDQKSPAGFDIWDFFLKNPFFEGCTLDFMQALKIKIGEDSFCKVFDRGITLLEEGAVGRSFFIIHSGTLELSQNEQSLGFLHQGDSIGEGFLLGHDFYAPATLKTYTLCRLIEIPCKLFVEILVSFPLERHLFSKKQLDQMKQKKSRKPQRTSTQHDPDELKKNIVDSKAAALQLLQKKRESWWRSLGPRVSTAEERTFSMRVGHSLKYDSDRRFLLPLTIDETDENAHLDISLLPPIRSMSPVEKKAVQNQLQKRVNARKHLRRVALSAKASKMMNQWPLQKRSSKSSLDRSQSGLQLQT